MVLIFSTTTSVLSDEYIDLFPADKLAVALYKIARDTNVELKKEKKSFLISGEWSNVNHAHSELEQYLTLETESFPSSDEVSDVQVESHLDNSQKVTPKKNAVQRGRKPGFSVDSGRFSNSNLPEPFVFHDGIVGNTSRPTTRRKADEKEIKDKTNLKNEVSEASGENDNKATVVNTDAQTLANNDAKDNEKTTSSGHQNKVKKESSDVAVPEVNETVNVKVEPVSSDTPINCDEGFDGDTDVDEQYLPDADGENIPANNGNNMKPECKSIKIENDSLDETLKQKTSKTRKKKSFSKDKKVKKKKEISVEKKNTEDEFKCSQCDYRGKKRSNLSEHVRRMHGDPLTCEICNKVFGLKKDLARHTKHVHSDPSHFCEICGKLYKFRRAYNDHMKIHGDNYVKPNFPCNICGKSFSTKYVLTGHVNSVHLGMKKSFVCPTCGRTFTQKNSYLMHANVHAGIKPFVCDVCGKAFSYEKSLREHKYMHDTERRFKCPVCEKTFRQKASLQIHSKVHKETRDYICIACGKGFTQKQALHRHERIHSGDKPFRCALCQRTFNDYSIIRRHMIMLHKRDPKDPSNWKHDIVCTMKRRSDFYIEGGTGYNSGERIPTEAPTVSDVDVKQNVNFVDANSMVNKEGDTTGEVLNSKQDFTSVKNENHQDDKMTGGHKDNYVEPSEDLHQLSQAAYLPISEKDSPAAPTTSPLPINYSLPADYSQAVRMNSESNDGIVQYQSVSESYRTVNSSNLLVPTMPVTSSSTGPEQLRTMQEPVTTDQNAHPQTLAVQWAYPGYPYYASSNFPQYQGPTSQ